MFHRINVRECFIAGGKASLVEAFDLKHKKKKNLPVVCSAKKGKTPYQHNCVFLVVVFYVRGDAYKLF